MVALDKICKILEAYLSGGAGLRQYLCGTEMLAEESSAVSDRHSFQNAVNTSICYGELLLHAKLGFKVVYGISSP